MLKSIASFDDYKGTFVQRHPNYGVRVNKKWSRTHYPLADPAIKDHLAQRYTVGGLAPWYPQFAILDIDDKDRAFAEAIRAELGLDENNSMLLASESADSGTLTGNWKTDLYGCWWEYLLDQPDISETWGQRDHAWIIGEYPDSARCEAGGKGKDNEKIF